MKIKDWFKKWWFFTGPISVLIAGIVIATSTPANFFKSQNEKGYPPICFVISDDDLIGYTPAYWLEREGIKNLDIKFVLSKCRGDVNGRIAESESLTPWVKRVGAGARHTE